ncbi:MAG: zinc ribbon domain-containing protein [Balneolales bacterium]
MPTYQYQREDGSTFEIMQSIKDDSLKTCPDSGQKVKRIISGGAGVVYKGEGWYVTDYKNKKVQPPSKTESTNGESKESSSKETPAAKTTPEKSESKA